MRNTITPAIALALTLTAASGPVGAQDEPLWQCQRWQDQIDYLSKLGKRGGSAQEMESWKRERRDHEDKFKDAGCSKYGGKVKRDR